ncbi:hypothetical protein BKA62DRAFT_751755 [Auriculariales sp. MPI-PUGE-AT-0066]|nr:hypothetical protein BKA62DRAFT_751755 [Auriculariales sp. MPI-PUGE-AT-0066]
MLSYSLLPIVLAAVAAVQAAPDPNVPRPTPSANANPTDTNNPRLVGKRWPYAQVPYMADTFSNERGIQIGYNQCNSSTVGEKSMCQTLIMNSIEDFCLYIPWVKDLAVGDAEAGMVAACTSEKWGSRVIPQGALKSVQFLNAKNYIAIAGRIDGTLLNLPKGDTGAWKPIGALAYSNALPDSKGTMTQAVVWNVFISDGIFCMKMCSNTAPNAMNLCEHIYDTQGCGVNLPAAYVDGVFETCDSDDMAPVFPTNTAIPASSNCVQATSSVIYKALPTPTTGGSSTTSGTNPSGSTTPGGSAAKLVGAGGLWTGMLSAVVAGLIGAAVVA